MTQTVPDISPLMPMHQDPLLVFTFMTSLATCWTLGPCDIKHYNDVIMSAMTSQTKGVSITCSTVCSGADQRKHQSVASLAFVRGIHRWAVDSPHKGPVTRKMCPFDDVIMYWMNLQVACLYEHIWRHKTEWESSRLSRRSWTGPLILLDSENNKTDCISNYTY